MIEALAPFPRAVRLAGGSEIFRAYPSADFGIVPRTIIREVPDGAPAHFGSPDMDAVNHRTDTIDQLINLDVGRIDQTFVD